MPKKHEEIVTRGIGEDILYLHNTKNMSIQKIADKHSLTYSAVQRYLRDQKLKNYNEDNLERIAQTDEYTALSVIDNFNQSVNHASKELAFTSIISAKLREELAEIIAKEGGVTALSKGNNKTTYEQWEKNSDKLIKLIGASQKMLDTYINLFSQVLDVQREVSYIKLITDILQKEDPLLYRKLQRGLDADPAAKRVLEGLQSRDVIEYWDTPISNRESLELELSKEESEK